MNPILKELIDECINYRKKRIPKYYLITAHRTIHQDDINSAIVNIFQWLKKSAISKNSNNRYNFQPDNKYSHNRLYFLLEACPLFKDILTLKQEGFGWNSSISDSERKEIIDYVDENYEIRIYK